MTEKKFQNRLSGEKSPYLLQHANNPVDWFPWGEEAFARAKNENKPIFLSIGYSTCHWCHVMEEESFENAQLAQLINQYFIPIKVDREERPDIDGVYMSAVMAMTGQGGWPLTVILTPDQKPFFGGTYFPPLAKRGNQGLGDALTSVHQMWENNRERIMESSVSITEILQEQQNQPIGSETFNDHVLHRAYEEYARNYDPRYAGFGIAPKFPASHNLSFLLRYHQRTGQRQALEMVEQTLTAMARGGIYDHLGGGFHRYATDQQWQIPHFEKMLYDQALLGRTYCEAYQATKKDFYARIARAIFDYVLTQMQYPLGGFYSAEDADSLDPDNPTHKKEGAFYAWRDEEIHQELSQEEAALFGYVYGIKKEGNARQDPHGEFTGKNIIDQEHDEEEAAQHFQKSIVEVKEMLAQARQKLWRTRQQRPRPHLDDKILVDWNGLMIASLAFGACVLNEPRYREAAERAVRFIEGRLVTNEGRLIHRFRDGEAAIPGTLDDYAFLIAALLDLYEGTFEIRYLRWAHDLTEIMVRLFWDEEKGGFYVTARDGETLLFRQKEIYDGAIPSGNSVAAFNLARLADFTSNQEWAAMVEKIFKAFSATINQHPSAYAQMLIACDFLLGPSAQIVVAGFLSDPLTTKMFAGVYQRFLPRKVVIHRPADEASAQETISLIPYVQQQQAIKGQPAGYICANHVCRLPATDLVQFTAQLDAMK
jgi:uncharacterized protein YyaL (SSP411 family)